MLGSPHGTGVSSNPWKNDKALVPRAAGVFLFAALLARPIIIRIGVISLFLIIIPTSHSASQLPPPGKNVVPLTPEIRTTTGTCFAVHQNGILLTAYHVVAGAKSIRVRLTDGTVRNAKLETFTAGNDLAIIRIDFHTPYFLPLAPPRSVRVGDYVFTMGYPAADLLGREPKFTEGSVSSLSGVGGDASLLQNLGSRSAGELWWAAR